MENKKFKLEFYDRNNFSYILKETHALTTKEGLINKFNKYVEEYSLGGEEVEKVDEFDTFIWRIKTNKYLLVARKDY